MLFCKYYWSTHVHSWNLVPIYAYSVRAVLPMILIKCINYSGIIVYS